jgi:hypothetical protein
MKMWMPVLITISCAGGLLVEGRLVAQESQEAKPEQQVLVERWMEFMTPGAEHELLKHRVGKWRVTMQIWATPSAQAMVSEGTAEVKLIMEGRYLTQTTRSNFQGDPYQGISIFGYDKLKDRFMSVSIDNFGTGFTISTGSYDEAAKEFRYATMSPDVVAGDYKRTRTVERVVSQDQWQVEMYDTSKDGQEFMVLKAVYRRPPNTSR